jgi:hypothetical protein
MCLNILNSKFGQGRNSFDANINFTVFESIIIWMNRIDYLEILVFTLHYFLRFFNNEYINSCLQYINCCKQAIQLAIRKNKIDVSEFKSTINFNYNLLSQY